jgi:hypothetical protein
MILLKLKKESSRTFRTFFLTWGMIFIILNFCYYSASISRCMNSNYNMKLAVEQKFVKLCTKENEVIKDANKMYLIP